MIKKKTIQAVLVLIAAHLTSPMLQACEVCYGAADSPIIDGMNMSIIFMLVLTYILIIGIAVCFFMMRRRSLQALQTEGETS